MSAKNAKRAVRRPASKRISARDNIAAGRALDEQARVDAVSAAAVLAANPKDTLGALKVDLGTIPQVATIYQALAQMDGAYKYGIKNWRNRAVRMTVYTTAIKRHTLQLEAGEDIDLKSGIPHTGHIMACCAIIEDARACGCLIDDRREKDMAAVVLNALTADNYDAATAKLDTTPARTLDEAGQAQSFECFLGTVVKGQQERRAAK